MGIPIRISDDQRAKMWENFDRAMFDYKLESIFAEEQGGDVQGDPPLPPPFPRPLRHSR